MLSKGMEVDMVNPQKSNVYAGRHVYMKQRIYSSQRKAKWIGIMYLLATFVVTILACLPHMAISDPTYPPNVSLGAEINVFDMIENFSGDILPFVVIVIISTMYDILFLNIIRVCIKLGWLFKKNASRLYGFNRNMYAMDDMSRIYSCTLSTTIVFHVFIILFAGKVEFDPITFILLGVGLLFHFVLGILGGHVSIFDTESRIVEIKRECGTFSAFFRNAVQLVVVGVLAFVMMEGNSILPFVQALITERGAVFKGDLAPVIMSISQIVLLGVWVLMVVYATGVKEFDMEGRHAPGRNAFLVYALIATIVTGLAYCYGRYVAKLVLGDEVLISVVAALVALSVEMGLRKYPGDKKDDDEEVPFQKFMRESSEQDCVEYYPATPQYQSPGSAYYGEVPCYDCNITGVSEEYYRQNYGMDQGYYQTVNTHHHNVRRLR